MEAVSPEQLMNNTLDPKGKSELRILMVAPEAPPSVSYRRVRALLEAGHTVDSITIRSARMFACQVSESCEAISQDRFNKQHMDCTNSRAYIPSEPNRDKKECLCRTSALPWRMNLGKEE